MKKDDELHQIRVGLLPKGFLATPEEVIQERGDVVGESVCVQVALKGVVAILGIEADFDVVFSPAVACENFLYSVAEVPFYFKDEAANSLLRISSRGRPESVPRTDTCSSSFSLTRLRRGWQHQ